jgi:translation initiation factor 2-alpha kinase 4
VPANVDGEYISKELLRIVRQKNPVYFSRLISSLYDQTFDIHKDFAYDFNSDHYLFDFNFARISAHLHSIVERILLNHGAVRFEPPRVLPKTGMLMQMYPNNRTVEYIDQNGDVVQMLYDLTVPFVRCISQHSESELEFPLKKYSIDRVYRKNLTGGQPITVHECDFDIIYQSDDNLMSPESEAIKFVYEILEHENFSSLINSDDYHVRVNHMKNLKHLFGNIGIPLSLRAAVFEILSQLHRPLKSIQIKGLLLKLGIDTILVDKLFNFDISLDLANELPSAYCADVEIRKMASQLYVNLTKLGIKSKVTFDPLMIFNPNIYEKGLVFQIYKKSRTKCDVIAGGGRYDTLFTKFQGPFTVRNRKLHAVGVNVALSKIISLISNNQMKQLDDKSLPKAEVLITFTGNKSSMLSHQLSIASEMWKSGISADIALTDDFSTQEFSHYKYGNDNSNLDYKYAIILKPKGSDSFIIKVKDLNSKAEVEGYHHLILVKRSVLVEFFREPFPKRSHEDISEQLRTPEPIVLILKPKKSKSKLHQAMISEKCI